MERFFELIKSFGFLDGLIGLKDIKKVLGIDKMEEKIKELKREIAKLELRINDANV